MTATVLNLDEGDVVVVDEGNVQHHAAVGYRLIAIVMHDDAVTQYREQNTNGYSQSVAHGAVVVSLPRFVMKRTKDEFILKMTAENASLTSSLRDVRTELGEAKKQSAATENKFADLNTTIAKAHESREYFENQWKESRDRNRTLEGDIAKLRTAVGDLRMKEILSGQA